MIRPAFSSRDHIAPGRRGVAEAAEDRQVVVDRVIDAERDGLAVRRQAEQQHRAAAPGGRRARRPRPRPPRPPRPPGRSRRPRRPARSRSGSAPAAAARPACASRAPEQHDLGRRPQPQQVDGEQRDRPVADHQHPAAGAERRPGQAPVDDGRGLGQHRVLGGHAGGERMHERGRHGDQAGGGAVPGEADLVVGLAQVGLAARAARAVTAATTPSTTTRAPGQRRVAGRRCPVHS